MKRRPIGLALAGGGPFGAIYELGALIALQESIDGLDLNDLRLAALRGSPQADLVDGGLPVVLSQTFRAVIHSRMAVGLANYRTQYRGADVILFQPAPDDSTIFITNLFSYATRRQVCEHAYQRTRADLRGTLQDLRRSL